MKTTLVILAVLLSMAGAQQTQAQVVWQGDAVIDTATAACGTIPGAPIRTDTIVRSVLKPKNVPGNAAVTSVSFFANNTVMFALVLNPGAAGTAAGSGSTASGVLKLNTVIPYTNFVQVPAAPTASTPSINLSGRIQDFLFVPNCDVAFRATYTLRTD